MGDRKSVSVHDTLIAVRQLPLPRSAPKSTEEMLTNPNILMKPMYLDERKIQIQGIVVGVLKRVHDFEIWLF